MTIAAVAMALNEADIIGLNIRHLFAEGIDEMYLAVGDSYDNTWNIVRECARDYQIQLYADTDEVWHQTAWTNRLISHAGADGHEWVVPFDVDEFVYATEGRTIAETLAECPHNNLYLRQWAHHSWDQREINPRGLPKVAFRWSPGVTVSMGAHESSLGPSGAWGVLDIRELQFRSFEHFCRKARERSDRLDPVERARGNGWHMTRLDGLTTEQMEIEWNNIQAIPTTLDPIPLRVPRG